MELTQLRYFKEIAELENMTKAAEKLHISQPALSKAIKNLEMELGVELFDRSRKRIQLNENGRIVLEQYTVILGEIEVMKKKLRQAQGRKLLEDLHLISPSIAALRKISLLFYSDNPFIAVTTESVPQEKILKKILSKEADIAISTLPYGHKQLTCMPYGEDRLLLAVPIDHPLAMRESICLSDLDGVSIFRYSNPKGYEMKDFLDYGLKQSSAKPNFIWLNDEKVYDEVALRGNHPSFTSTISLFSTNISTAKKLIPITGPYVSIPYYLIYRADRWEYLLPFIDWAKQNFSKVYLDEYSQNVQKN